MKLDLKLESMVKRFAEVELLISDPNVLSDKKRYKDLMVEYSHLGEIVSAYNSYKEITQSISEAKGMLEQEDDQEMKEMAREELKDLESQIEPLLQELQLLLVPKDPLDGKDIIMEIRAGTGGDEAALFAADLYRMYARYAEQKG
ncbi:MAG: peptide chain release factor 1, partial [Spirochaetaceae bacterium 4572_7]